MREREKSYIRYCDSYVSGLAMTAHLKTVNAGKKDLLFRLEWSRKAVQSCSICHGRGQNQFIGSRKT